ncbi:hypothetical protein BDZ91DRAFT_761087 [Kalaharituber pfeilii]|nr:hypothetical protein BDZ91DRAFT_761087 [Kalaharituber pfeilii]
MPTLMTNPPLHKTHSNTTPAAPATKDRDFHKPHDHHGSTSRRSQRRSRCNCFPTRRSNTSTNSPSASGTFSRPAPGGGSSNPTGTLRAEGLQISNPIPIGDDIPVGSSWPRSSMVGRRPGNLIPIVPFRDTSSPDTSDLSSEASRTASAARTPVSDLSDDTDITSVMGSSDGESSLGTGSRETTSLSSGYLSTTTGSATGTTRTTATAGYSTMTTTTTGSSGATSSLHMQRLSMNLDSRLSNAAVVGSTIRHVNAVSSSVEHPYASKQRPRPAPLNLDSINSNPNPTPSLNANLGRSNSTRDATRDRDRAVRNSTQSMNIPLHMAHPGNRNSAVVQFSDPSGLHHSVGLGRSQSSSKRGSKYIPKEVSESTSPSTTSDDEIHEIPAQPRSHAHGARPTSQNINLHRMSMNNPNIPVTIMPVPPPAPTPPPMSPTETSTDLETSCAYTYTEKSYTGGTSTSVDASSIVSSPEEGISVGPGAGLGRGQGSGLSAPQPGRGNRRKERSRGVSDGGDASATTGGGAHQGQHGGKHTLKSVAKAVLLLPPLVTVLVADKAWRKVRRKEPRRMGDVPGVWKVLGMAG